MLRKLLKQIPFAKAAVRFFRNPIRYLKIIDSDNYIFLATFEPGHFYSPIPTYRDLFNKNKEMIACDRSIIQIPGIELNTEAQVRLVSEFQKYYQELPFTKDKSPDYRYWFDNNMLGYGDAVILYSMLRHFRPKKIIEIGSGFSSALMLDVSEMFLNSDIDFTFIEPYPDRLYSLLSSSDKTRNKIIDKKIQGTSLELFRDLCANDILFIDSSHVAKGGSDLLYIMSEVVPILNKDVIIHFHDIFWPFEYPDEWFKDGRAWNEAYVLKTFLQFNSSFEVVYFNSQMERHYASALKEKLPIALKKSSTYPLTQTNSSLWLRKTN